MDGFPEGRPLGLCVGWMVGTADGNWVGRPEGQEYGCRVGLELGHVNGVLVG